jgi:hypothetical protein
MDHGFLLDVAKWVYPNGRRKEEFGRPHKLQPPVTFRPEIPCARTLWDGSVEIYAIGEDAALVAFRKTLAEGPIGAAVKGIEESEDSVHGRYNRFFIEHAE